MPTEEEVRALAQTLGGLAPPNANQAIQALQALTSTQFAQGPNGSWSMTPAASPPTTKGATPVATSSKTKAIDADCTYFHYDIDLAVTPPLKSAAAKSLSGEYFGLTTSKDEDVVLVDGRMEIVTTEITAVKPKHKASEQLYGYPTMKAEVERIATECAAAGSNLNGNVVVQRGADDGVSAFWRLKVVDNNVVLEPALLGWPDGTTTPFPGA